MVDEYNNARYREGHIFKPLPVAFPKWKVEIKYVGDTTYTNISDYVYQGNVSHGSRDRVSTASLKVEDLNGNFYQTIQGGEWLRIWLGYGTATYKEFTGRIVRKQMDFQPTTGFELSLDLRAWPEMTSKKLSFTFDNVLIEEAIGTILNEVSDVTYLAPGICIDRISMRFIGASPMSMIKEMCNKYGLEFFIDANGAARLFYAEDSRIDETAIVINQNLLSLTELGIDMDRIRNSVKFFGKQENFVTWIRTAQDEDLIEQYWQMDEETFDSAVMNNVDAMDRVQKELDYRKALTEEGRIKVMGMENIIPGKQIYCAIPPVVNSWKRMNSVSHDFNQEGWLTHMTIEFDSYDSFARTLERDKRISGLQSIPLEKLYDETIVIDPANDSDYITLTGLEIANERISCIDAAPSSGTFTIRSAFPGLTVAKKVISAVVVVDGVNLQKSFFYVSNDAQNTELSFTNTELATEQKSFNTINNKIRIRGSLVDVNADNEVTIRRIAIFLKYE